MFHVFGHYKSNFAKNLTDSCNQFTNDDIIKGVHFSSTSSVFESSILIFQYTVGIPVGAYFASLLANMFVYPQESEIYTETFQRQKEKASCILFLLSYIWMILLLNNSYFNENLHLLYQRELAVYETRRKYTSYLNYILNMLKDGRLRIKIYDKHDDTTFQQTTAHFSTVAYLCFVVRRFHISVYIFCTCIFTLCELRKELVYSLHNNCSTLQKFHSQSLQGSRIGWPNRCVAISTDQRHIFTVLYFQIPVLRIICKFTKCAICPIMTIFLSVVIHSE